MSSFGDSIKGRPRPPVSGHQEPKPLCRRSFIDCLCLCFQTSELPVTSRVKRFTFGLNKQLQCEAKCHAQLWDQICLAPVGWAAMQCPALCKPLAPDQTIGCTQKASCHQTSWGELPNSYRKAARKLQTKLQGGCRKPRQSYRKAAGRLEEDRDECLDQLDKSRAKDARKPLGNLRSSLHFTSQGKSSLS